MLSAREIPDAIQWHEGMMLAPPHFQQMAARVDQLIAYDAAAASPFHWGVIQFQLDRVGLISGRLRVLELEAVMPDGLIVHYSATDAGGLEADLTPFIDPIAQPTLTVHLCVPAVKPGTVSAPGDLPRYASIEGPMVRDECDGEGEIRIPRLKPRLSLLVTSSPGQKPPQKYISIPLAHVVYQHEAFALADFAPPTLALAPQSLLGRMGSDLARRIREKALFLAERASSPAAAGNGRAVQDTLSEINGLVAALPYLEAVLAAGVCHLFQVYLALCQVVGHMAGFGTGPVPPSLSLEKLWEMRIKGAGRQQVAPSIELDISPARGTLLFMIENDISFIAGNEMLEIWNSDQGGGRARIAEIVLYAQS